MPYLTPVDRVETLSLHPSDHFGVHENYVRVPDGLAGQDERGRLWDILFMLHFAIKRAPESEGDTILYTVFVRNDDTAPKPVKLKAIVHPDDEGAPCITVMLPHED